VRAGARLAPGQRLEAANGQHRAVVGENRRAGVLHHAIEEGIEESVQPALRPAAQPVDAAGFR
jgi:hypothetical protein